MIINKNFIDGIFKAEFLEKRFFIREPLILPKFFTFHKFSITLVTPRQCQLQHQVKLPNKQSSNANKQLHFTIRNELTWHACCWTRMPAYQQQQTICSNIFPSTPFKVRIWNEFFLFFRSLLSSSEWKKKDARGKSICKRQPKHFICVFNSGTRGTHKLLRPKRHAWSNVARLLVIFCRYPGS